MMRLRRRGWHGGLLVALALGLAGPVWALPYTLVAPVVIDGSNNGGSGVLGTLLPVTDASGTSICLGGSCTDPTSQDWLLVQFVLGPGSADVDQIGIGAVGSNALGSGHFDDPDETPTGGSVASGVAQIDYDHLNLGSALNLEAGETSDRLFAAFASGDLPGPGLPCCAIPPGTASFSISSGANFSVQGAIVAVPEPAVLLLVGPGLLLGLGAAARQRPGKPS